MTPEEIADSIDEKLDKRLEGRCKLTCTTKSCTLRSGLYCWLEQKQMIMNRKCIYCNGKLIELKIISNK